jgi:hypothetical protein
MGTSKYHIVCVHNFAQHDNKIWALFKLNFILINKPFTWGAIDIWATCKSNKLDRRSEYSF